jgi:hypothetical protein
MSFPRLSPRFSPIALLALPLLGPLGSPSARAQSAPIDFVHQIAPILKEHCGGCHLGDKKKGAFSMNNAASLQAGSENGKVVDAEHLDKSRLLEVLFSKDPDVVMPPKDKDKEGRRPTAEQLELLKRWILSGAAWEEGFSFQKPAYNAPVKHRPPVLPAARKGMEHPLDRLLEAYNQKHGLPELKGVDDAAFARRVHLDLIGLLPEPAALEAFLKDADPGKRARLVEDLLGRREEYAEHWLTFWNDLLRNDYGGTGFITGGRKQVTQWLHEALRTNKPYDRMVREIVNPGPETAGFAEGITWRGTVSASQTREVQYSQSVSQSFLGLNMKCASCHDSFIDRWKLTDAYGIAAIYAAGPVEIARCEKPTGKTAVPAWPFPEIGQIDPKAPREERLKQLADLMAHPDNGWLARTIVNRLWASLMGRGLVHPVDAMGTEPWSEEILDYLGWHLAQNGYNLKETLRLITTSRAYQAEAVHRVKDDQTGAFVFRGPRAKRMTAEQFVDTLWQLTGAAPKTWDAPVRRGEPGPEELTGKALRSNWVRVSVQDAGAAVAEARKAKPVALRKRFVVEGKPAGLYGVAVGQGGALRIFLNGAEQKGGALRTFGNESEIRLGGGVKTGENTLVLVGVPQGKEGEVLARFEAEIPLAGGAKMALGTGEGWEVAFGVADELLRSGKVALAADASKDSKEALEWTGGVAVVEEPKAAVVDSARFLRDLVWANRAQPAARASLLKSDLLMRTLGRPNRDQIVTSRPQDLSTLEALDLSAGQKLSEILGAGARRMGSVEPGKLVDGLYLQALSRQPTGGERAAALELLGEKPGAQAVEDLMWALVVQPEFQLVR